MKKIIIISAAAAVIVAGFATLNLKKDKSHSEHKLSWSYEGNTGPSFWGSLSEKYRLCGNGAKQSPINIPASGLIEVESNRLNINYNETPLEIINNGHTIKINYTNDSNLKVGKNSYKLLQFHFHTPSEYKINNIHFPMSMHLVHGDENGKLAVVGVLFQEGEANPTLEKILNNLPKEKNKVTNHDDVMIDAKNLIPENHSFYQLSGSLTTPPCSEDVLWNIFESSVTASKEQLERFKSVMGHNARPIQKTNDRKILMIQTD